MFSMGGLVKSWFATHRTQPKNAAADSISAVNRSGAQA